MTRLGSSSSTIPHGSSSPEAMERYPQRVQINNVKFRRRANKRGVRTDYSTNASVIHSRYRQRGFGEANNEVQS